MERYCVSCQKNSSVRITKGNRFTIVSNCAICGRKKSRFIENQETSRLELHSTNFLIKFKMHKIVNKFLLAGDKFMPELHLR